MKANTLLDNAEKIANERGLVKFQEEVKLEKEKLLSEIDNWHELIDSSSPLMERIEQSRLLDYVKKAQKLATAEG